MVEIKKGNNKFFVGENQEEPLAEIHFVPTGSKKLIIDHTYVSDELRGQGIGEALVKQMVVFAREEGKEIIPLCPFAKIQIDQHKEYQDVLAKS